MRDMAAYMEALPEKVLGHRHRCELKSLAKHKLVPAGCDMMSARARLPPANHLPHIALYTGNGHLLAGAFYGLPQHHDPAPPRMSTRTSPKCIVPGLPGMRLEPFPTHPSPIRRDITRGLKLKRARFDWAGHGTGADVEAEH